MRDSVLLLLLLVFGLLQEARAQKLSALTVSPARASAEEAEGDEGDNDGDDDDDYDDGVSRK